MRPFTSAQLLVIQRGFALLLIFCLAIGTLLAADIPTRAELDHLALQLAHHDELYYQQAQPEISDAAYDQLRARYAAIADELHVPAAERYGQMPGNDHAAGFTQVAHRVPMLSLDKVIYDHAGTAPERLIAWYDGAAGRKNLRERHDLPADADLSLLVEPKIDGVSLSCTYRAGRLVQALSRGDGVHGDDITAQILASGAVPAQVPAFTAGAIEIRGEIYLPHAAFRSLNEQLVASGNKPLVNERNGCAGLIKSQDASTLAGKGLRVFIYQVAWAEGFVLPTSQCALIRWLGDCGLPVIELGQRVANVQEAAAYCTSFLTRRNDLGYDIDGMVVKLDDRRLHDRLGATAHHPYWCIAFKFPPERISTRLLGVTAQVGRSGVLTPVAELEPVTLAKTTVRRASLHNWTKVERLRLRLGDQVWVEKAGEIIPQVLGVAEAGLGARIARPTHCPVCGQETLTEDVFIFCPNPLCPAQRKERLGHFASRRCLDIAGCGDALIAQLVDDRGVSSPAQLFTLTAQQLTGLTHLGDQKAAHFLAAIAQAKGRGLARVLAGLGLRLMGEKLADKLSAHFGSAQALLNLAQRFAEGDTTALAELTALQDIGEHTARLTLQELHQPTLRQVFAELAAAGVTLTHVGQRTRIVPGVTGKTFVLTGTLPTWGRKEAADFIKAAGGRCADAVTRKTDFVVVGTEAGTKRDKAQELGVTIIDEAALRRMLGQ